MHVVLIEVDTNGKSSEEGRQLLRDQIVPAVQKLPGFRSGVWLNKSDSDHGLSLTIWDTREQAEGMVSMFGPDSGDQAGGTVSRCEINKVTASAFAFFSPGNLLI